MHNLLILNERDLHHPNAGGAEVNLFEVGRRLARRGYALTLLCSSFPGAPAEEVVDEIRVVRFGNPFTYYARLPLAVRRHVRTDTVIVEHLCKLPFFARLYSGVPVLPVTHHLFGRTAFRQVSPPVAVVVRIAEALIPAAYRSCLFVAVSPSTKADLVRRGISAERVRLIPNGVDCERYSVEARRGGRPPTILVLGRIEPYKRVELALEAMLRIRRQVADVRLVIVGGGRGLRAVRAAVSRLGLENCVESTGPVTEEEKLRRIHQADLVLNTSEKEGWGLTVLEAAACGLPTVACDVPGLRDSVVDGSTGVLVADGDVEALVAASVALLRDPNRRDLLGTAAREWAERFSWDRAAEDMARSIEEVSSGAGATRWTPDGETPF